MSESRPEEPKHTGLPPLLPPDRTKPDRKRARTPLGLILLSFFILLAGVGTVVFLLPRDQEPTAVVAHVPQSEPAQDATVQQPGRTPQPLPISTERRDFYALKVQAEAQGLPRWAPEQYAGILNNLSTAESLSAQQEYPEAAELYRQSSFEITHLLEDKKKIFQALLRDGAQALQQGDSQAALSSVNRALAIYPDNPEAAEIERQARVREDVLQRYSQAETLEYDKNYAVAAETLEGILEMDPTFAPAVEARLRINRILKIQAVQDEMNAFYQSIELGDLDTARGSLNLLKRLEPNDPLVAQAELFFNERLEASTIKDLRVKAEQYVAVEQWQRALQTYQDILAINPETMVGTTGSEAAAKRLELDEALEKTLGQPHRLQDPGVLKEASQLLAYAKQYLPGGARLTAQTAKLQTMLARASAEIRVTLESDNLTDVTIYHIGRFGRFVSKHIDLVPGTYTIIGSRTGYRDMRKTVEIATGDTDTRFIIICNEPI